MKKTFAILLICAMTLMSFSATVLAKTGDVIGYAKYTDISAYINHYPITSYNINGYTAIVAEDLQNYGFNVEWNGTERSLSIKRNNTATQIKPSGTVYKYSAKAGQDSFPYLETDIVTYVNGGKVESFNIGGKTCIYIDSLAPCGNIAWVPEIRAIKLWVDGMSIAEYKPLEEVPMVTMYSMDGRTIEIEKSEVESYKSVGWYTEPVNIVMSEQDKANAISVRWMHQQKVSYYENENLHRLFFGFKNNNGTEIYAPARVYIKIVNSNNETVYDNVKVVKYSDFRNWTRYNTTNYLADIEIPTADITPGSSETGKLYFKVENPGYLSFDEQILSIYDLPLIKYSDMCSLQLPEIPKILHDYGYDKKVDSSYRITNISYKFEDSYDNEVKLTLYFDGEKYFDKDGAGQSSTCRVGWKLYDLQGYVIKDGTFYSPALNMGEKFRNEEELIYDLKPGDYRLEILSTNER